ncbi:MULTISPECIES: NifU family protein [Haloferax]|nr:NifU family protein [Haloferax mediterranei]AFK19131.2 NifU domain-containing protein [Haloferax mediterranei ATCC 33500]AHZ21508.1 nitrogen fixation protein NifU [Haloferax mediterranei ATCC 33500]MDX5989227.1 NifU family protein [Haloferax mediterranei ATCC 33500]
MTSQAPEKSLEERIELFMRRNFPQIQMHGGSAGIDALDEETGEVWISLTGACSGCGISPMTIQALKSRLVAEFDEIDAVHASTGGSYDDDEPGSGFEPDVSDAPF